MRGREAGVLRGEDTCWASRTRWVMRTDQAWALAGTLSPEREQLLDLDPVVLPGLLEQPASRQGTGAPFHAFASVPTR